MLLRNLLSRLWRRLRDIPSRGLPKPAARDSFDVEHGTTTSGIVWWTNPWSEHFVSGIRYEPCSPEVCRLAIEQAGIEPGEFSFIDLGCGKGRPLIIASRYGFRQLIGVDYSAKLCRIAERNLSKCGVRNFRIVHADATAFPFTRANTFAFLYHPFQEDVLKTVLEKMRDATEGCQLVIVYVGEGGDLLAAQKWLELSLEAPQLRIFQKRLLAASAST